MTCTMGPASSALAKEAAAKAAAVVRDVEKELSAQKAKGGGRKSKVGTDGACQGMALRAAGTMDGSGAAPQACG